MNRTLISEYNQIHVFGIQCIHHLYHINIPSQPSTSATSKLQKAGYKQAVEKWESDSDSDASDEADLAV